MGECRKTLHIRTSPTITDGSNVVLREALRVNVPLFSSGFEVLEEKIGNTCVINTMVR